MLFAADGVPGRCGPGSRPLPGWRFFWRACVLPACWRWTRNPGALRLPGLRTR